MRENRDGQRDIARHGAQMRIGSGLGLVACLALAACGGGNVSGDVGRACMSGGREAANSSLCSCIQTAANQSLNAADQRRAAAFFGDPQEAEDARSSDTTRDDAFWARYRTFVDRARAQCG